MRRMFLFLSRHLHKDKLFYRCGELVVRQMGVLSYARNAHHRTQWVKSRSGLRRRLVELSSGVDDGVNNCGE